MASRIHLDVDILEHINNLTFFIFRSEEPGVDENDTLIMELDQELTVKVNKMEYGEILKRNPLTPYSFFTSRHYVTENIHPALRLGITPVDPMHLYYLPSQKEIEVHSGDIGIYDGRPIYLDYEYTTQPVKDDYDTESGKTYHGPPASALSNVDLVEALQDFVAKKFLLSWSYTKLTKPFYYRIYAKDKNGNMSPWSDEKMEQLYEANVLFRVQSSDDNEHWKDEELATLQEWLVEYRALDRPHNVLDCRITPLSSKKAEIDFENPWYHYKHYLRQGAYYRVRAEDDQGGYTDWYTIGPLEAYFEPLKLIIRRQLNTGAPSSKELTDAFTVFTLDGTTVDWTQPRIRLVDDQLTDKNIYSYSFFYEDELGLEADPIYGVSDHMKWSNLIVFAGEVESDEIPYADFYMSFSISKHTMDIGVGKA